MLKKPKQKGINRFNDNRKSPREPSARTRARSAASVASAAEREVRALGSRLFHAILRYFIS